MISDKIYRSGAEYCTAGKFVSDRAPMLHQRRKIDSFVLFYCIKGTLYMSEEGKEFTLSPDCYLILPAGREHFGSHPSPAGLSYYWCHFYVRGEYSFTLADDGRELLLLEDNGALCIPTFGQIHDRSRMHLLFHQLIDSSLARSDISKTICTHFLDIILAELSTLSESEPAPPCAAVASSITEWIRLNAPHVRSVSEISAHFGYNSEYLTTMLKKVCGKTLITLLNESKIEYSKRLLCNFDLSVRDIAHESGFSDEKYFQRVFKRLCDISPGEFRKAYFKQHMNDR